MGGFNLIDILVAVVLIVAFYIGFSNLGMKILTTTHKKKKPKKPIKRTTVLKKRNTGKMN